MSSRFTALKHMCKALSQCALTPCLLKYCICSLCFIVLYCACIFMLYKSALQRIFLLLFDKKKHQLHQEIIELFIVDRPAFTLFSTVSNVGDETRRFFMLSTCTLSSLCVAGTGCLSQLAWGGDKIRRPHKMTGKHQNCLPSSGLFEK